MNEEKFKFFVFNKPEGVSADLPFEDENSLSGYFTNLEEVYFLGAKNENHRGLTLVTNDREIGGKFENAKVDVDLAILTKKPVRKDLLKQIREIKGTFAGKLKTPREIVMRLSLPKIDEVIDLVEKNEAGLFDVNWLAIAGVRMNMLGAGNSRLMTKKERRGLIEKL